MDSSVELWDIGIQKRLVVINNKSNDMINGVKGKI